MIVDGGPVPGAPSSVWWEGEITIGDVAAFEVAEREGPGWRAPAETPAEHEVRLTQAASKWREAAPVIRAFEALRYGETDPDRETVEGAREAFRRMEAAG